MNSDPSLAMFRRFGKIRIRSLLYKQDHLAELERRLYVLDLKEDDQVNLSSRRFDNNAERKEIMAEIDIALKDYGISSPMLAFDYDENLTVLRIRDRQSTVQLQQNIRFSSCECKEHRTVKPVD